MGSTRRSSNGIADDLLVLKLSKHGGVEIVFNGPYSVAHTLIVDKKDTSNGQVQMRLSRLRALNRTVPDAERVPAR